ncbi:hypothetical protein [Pragia fontium]|uniref:Adhesin n=2 Tax=Pragia fontium TaxID=82985 RepID=A0AAJ5BGI7_9GAMM|nr:hypothetical protein [Pragia fontium]AKJ42004.1 hypothetical protein QQ39_07845 [Pragia fontium]SFC45033.1 hypothetical protein SAMN02745723_102387 [Pragia fontium DSM 5563 = ATCC 49100]SUB82235.1 Uncharacterised protein [Pragia fontium]VEJ55001.1 Uncharacterised protein [Pragia fontium]GKX61967.1 hypothetical protein SOASR032_05360 [Pragia fontium]
MKYLYSFFALLLISPNSAYSIQLAGMPHNVISGVSNCLMTNTGSDTWQASFTANWALMGSIPPDRDWGVRTGRGFLIFQYDKNGTPIKAYFPPDNIKMNGHAPIGSNYGTYTNGNGYLTYGYNYSPEWNIYDPYTADVVINVKDANVAIVALYPTNVYSSGIIYDQVGAVYFAASQATQTCQLMDNPNKPPAIVNLTMNAPDWDLGEIAAGKQQKVMTNAADRLCISYLSTESAGKDFIVTATNANGIVNNRFVLKHNLNPTSLLPYTLTLDNMGKQILLPNINNSSIRFEDSGNQTCFTPTFDLYGNEDQELGDYSDVINYEIVTKS